MSGEELDDEDEGVLGAGEVVEEESGLLFIIAQSAAVFCFFSSSAADNAGLGGSTGVFSAGGWGSLFSMTAAAAAAPAG